MASSEILELLRILCGMTDIAKFPRGEGGFHSSFQLTQTENLIVESVIFNPELDSWWQLILFYA